MITKRLSERRGKILVTFELPSMVWADQVYLCGDFNGWDPRATAMRQDNRSGAWQVTLELDLGRRYEFRYLVDDTDWNTDYQADRCVQNPIGVRNSSIDLSNRIAESQADIQATGRSSNAPSALITTDELTLPVQPITAKRQAEWVTTAEK